MAVLRVTARTADVGWQCHSADEFVQKVIALTLDSWAQGAEVVLWPEFMWLALERFAPGWEAASNLYWNEHFPKIEAALNLPGKCVILGTAPFLAGEEWRNRAVIFSDGKHHFQDKLCLTPWESMFQAGGGIHRWMFKSWKLAVLVCLDVEIPEHSVALRGQEVDVLLIPSATETLLGVERIGRCASARSVELGCHVVVSHLVGQTNSSLVDENVGRLSGYSPSQTAFKRQARMEESELFETGWHFRQFEFERKSLDHMRRNKAETNPANVKMPIFPSE